MAKSLNSLHFLPIFFMLILLLAHSEVTEGKICERRSKTWTGPCINSRKCDSQCKSRENARSGSCHWDAPGFACFCYFNCMDVDLLVI